MKKSNNNSKYRNNNNQIYSLNYKFDSCSIAGKVSGTALDLIKKYNELAKEAQSGSDYVNAEIFRQYAEHYRKIVTEINEKKNLNFTPRHNVAQFDAPQEAAETPAETNAISSAIENDDEADVELFDSADEAVNPADEIEISGNVVEMFSAPKEAEAPAKKAFTVIEITPERAMTSNAEAVNDEAKAPRRYTRKKDLAV